MKDTALVIPTIRENCFNDFVKRWKDVGLFDHVDLIVMEDNPERTFRIDIGDWVTHFTWDDIEDVLGKDSWIIPRRSDTVRSFAYYQAWKKGYEYILTLDDDCYPCTDGMRYDGKAFVDAHKGYLTGRTRWFNTLNSVKPRGIPFYNLGKNERVIVNHGLWTNVLDYDAPYQLANPIPEQFSYNNQVVPSGLYFPMCGMNVMWKREATVLMYHLLMGQAVEPYFPTQAPKLTKLPFDRFGDIWCGVLMKKIADLMGYQVSTGMPYIRHERASNPFTNLKKEANGIEVNEKFWEHVDRFRLDGDRKFDNAYFRLGKHVAEFKDYPEHLVYFRQLGEAMQIWANLFSPPSEEKAPETKRKGR